MAKEVIRKINKKVNNRKAVKIFWVIFLSPFAIVALLLLLISMGVFGKLPSFDDLENPKSNLATEIYSEDGEILGNFYKEYRSYTPYEDISPNLIAATIATEDARYYSHSGIDFISLLRVGFRTIALGQKQGGGSTITQQLAKNLYKTREEIGYNDEEQKTQNIFITKFKEWITAVMLEYNYTKEEIIAMYLNTVLYGDNAYGIKSAARTFFNKMPDEVTIEEAALLVGVVNAPTRYNPVRNPENALRRRNTVISRMYKNDFITKKDCDSLQQVPITLDFHPVSHNTGTGTYFREMLRLVMNMERPVRSRYSNDWDYRKDLKTWDENPLYGWCVKNKKADGTQYNLYRDGLKISTTINARMQRHAEDSLFTFLKNDRQPKMDAEVKSRGLFKNITKEEEKNIINRAIRTTDRYRTLNKEGKTWAEIEKDFSKPSEMRIFSYNGAIDTVMTPIDSILYYKRQFRASFMAMDPHTGYVKAYVGGPDFMYFKWDNVTQGKRQVGSTIKPFIYTFAIDFLNLNPCTPVMNLPVSIENPNGVPWTPTEAGAAGKAFEATYDGEYHPLEWGLIQSRNNFSAWIMKQAKSPADVANFIYKLGIKNYVPPVESASLGVADLTLYEMVAAFAIYANNGVYTEPMFVTRIEDNLGNTIASFTPQTSDAINEQTAFTVRSMMEKVVSYGTGGRLRWMFKVQGDLAGKTGTTQGASDGWFIGMAPRIVAGVWVGAEDRSVHLRTDADGARAALPIFAKFMNAVHNDPGVDISPEDKFTVPPGVVKYYCPQEVYSDMSPADSTYVEEDSFFD